MSGSCSDDRIDEYLLGRLTQEERSSFEDHYFNCPACFQELKIRAEVLRVIRSKGRELFEAGSLAAGVPAKPQRFAFKPVWRWLTAAAAVVLIVGIAWLTRPSRQEPVFTLSGDDTVRGQAVALLSPRGDVAAAPLYLEWSPLAQGIEYSVSLFDQQPLWSESTRECRLRIPEEVRRQMVPGRTYSWQVKAFSPEGALTALSSRLAFKIAGPN